MVTFAIAAIAHSSDAFSWDPTKRQFSADASDIFGPLAAPTARLERVDGELGFRMKSARTGKTAWFAMHSQEFDGGDDLLFTRYRCHEHAVHAVIYND